MSKKLVHSMLATILFIYTFSAAGLQTVRAAGGTDATPPSAFPTISPAPNAAGWNIRNVTVTWNWADEAGGSGIDTSNCTTSSSTNVVIDYTNVANIVDLTATCADLAGNVGSASQTIRLDLYPPKLIYWPIYADGSFTLNLNQIYIIYYTCSDDISGIAACTGTVPSGSAIDSSTLGFHIFHILAMNNAGASVGAGGTYFVVYPFSGFLQPVQNAPTVNSVKAGSAVPVKFSLGADYGLNILASTPTIQFTSCSTGEVVNAIDNTSSAGNSSLSYDATSNQYTYTWKTDKAWAGRCGTFQLTTVDTVAHSAQFQFTK